MKYSVILLCAVILLILTGCKADIWTDGNAEVLTASGNPRVTEAEDNSETVYYTEGGSVWHTRADCSALKNAENIIESTQKDAFLHGKSRVCSKCGTKAETIDN